MKLRTLLLALNGATFFFTLVAIGSLTLEWLLPFARIMAALYFQPVILIALVPFVFVLNLAVIIYQLANSHASVRLQDHLFIVLSVNLVIWYLVFWTI